MGIVDSGGFNNIVTGRNAFFFLAFVNLFIGCLEEGKALSSYLRFSPPGGAAVSLHLGFF